MAVQAVGVVESAQVARSDEEHGLKRWFQLGSCAPTLRREPRHGGAFWLVARDNRDGRCFARTDSLGRVPLLWRRRGAVPGTGGVVGMEESGEGAPAGWVLANSTDAAVPHAGAWTTHHPRHVVRIAPASMVKGGGASSTLT